MYLWRTLENKESQKIFRDAIKKWRGCPYKKSQSSRTMGADCVYTCLGVYDECFGYERRKKIPHLPKDAGKHKPLGGYPTVKAFRDIYGATEVSGKGYIIEGDLIIFQSGQDHGNHCALATPLWKGHDYVFHNIQPFSSANFSTVRGLQLLKILKVYRLPEEEISKWSSR